MRWRICRMRRWNMSAYSGHQNLRPDALLFPPVQDGHRQLQKLGHRLYEGAAPAHDVLYDGDQQRLRLSDRSRSLFYEERRYGGLSDRSHLLYYYHAGHFRHSHENHVSERKCHDRRRRTQKNRQRHGAYSSAGSGRASGYPGRVSGSPECELPVS